MRMMSGACPEGGVACCRCLGTLACWRTAACSAPRSGSFSASAPSCACAPRRPPRHRPLFLGAQLPSQSVVYRSAFSCGCVFGAIVLLVCKQHGCTPTHQPMAAAIGSASGSTRCPARAPRQSFYCSARLGGFVTFQHGGNLNHIIQYVSQGRCDAQAPLVPLPGHATSLARWLFMHWIFCAGKALLLFFSHVCS